MFIFYILGVGLPCRLIFCQFWLCEEAQCVYLRLHLGSLKPLLILVHLLLIVGLQVGVIFAGGVSWAV